MAFPVCQKPENRGKITLTFLTSLEPSITGSFGALAGVDEARFTTLKKATLENERSAKRANSTNTDCGGLYWKGQRDGNSF